MTDRVPSLDEIFDRLDIEPGETVYFASDLARFWETYGKHHSDFSPQKVLRLLQERVTEEGTLLLPTYSWDFCHGLGFDIRKTQPKTGALNKLALRTPGFRRTKHAIYSLAVWGKDRDFYASLENTDAWGKDSPFHDMYIKDAAIIQFCVSAVNSLTFGHYVEQSVGVPFRFIKAFTGDYTDENGVTTERTYSMYCRYLDYVSPYSPEWLDKWYGDNVSEVEISVFGAPLRKMHARAVYELIKGELIRSSDTHVYTQM